MAEVQQVNVHDDGAPTDRWDRAVAKIMILKRERRLSNEGIAESCSMSPRSFYRYIAPQKQDRSRPGFDALVSIADGLGISLDWLAGRSAQDQRQPPSGSPKPWQLLAACSVLRDDHLTDAEARKAALTFLQQLEVPHG